MSNESDTMYDILHAMGKDAGFLYETIDTYIKDAQSANKTELVETWQTIKKDRLRHLHMLRGLREGNTCIIVQTQTYPKIFLFTSTSDVFDGFERFHSIESLSAYIAVRLSSGISGDSEGSIFIR